ncbi:MAG: DUF2239 family protein [Pseudobdellovibrio sp.]
MYTYTAFDEFQIIAKGQIDHIALELKKYLKLNKESRILIFSDLTGKQIDIDLSGTDKEVMDRLKVYNPTQIETPISKAGRPKLGVVPREISLLPQHWEWLNNQDGGASATIRKLIDEKIKLSSKTPDKIKSYQEGTYKFLSAIAGNFPHFEDVTRYLYRKDKKKFEEHMNGWPKDIIKHALHLSKGVFD